MINPEKVFRELGGQFISTPHEIIQKLSKIKAFLFDWDGVFNSGYKGEGTSSMYSEPDSMGTNLMRFGYYMQNDQLPFTAIITGELNESAFNLSEREHFNALFFKMKNKRFALDYLEKRYGIQPDEVCFFYDDVLDLAIAEPAGLRIMINRQSSPLFTSFVKENHHADYVTKHTGSQNGVREASEMIMAFSDNFSNALEERIAYSPTYRNYLKERNEISTRIYTQLDNKVVPFSKENQENR